ncbi:MAG: EAL domain-containing protein [Peptococcaceae bacterium]|nr:EAL domain-containing protein [Peptococcaceae bacterium]
MSSKKNQSLVDSFNEESDNRFFAVTESATDAIITIDSDGIVVMWNRAAEEIFGYSRQEIIGNSLELIVPERFWRLHDEGMKKVVSTGQSKLMGKTIELLGKRKDGNEFFIELSLSQWKMKEGIYFTGIIRDITLKKRAEDAIRQATVQLKDSIRQQNLKLIETNKKLQFELKMRKRIESELEKSINIINTTQQQLSDIIDFLPDPTFAVNSERKVIAWNRAIEKLTGIKSEDILLKGDYAYAIPFYGEARPILIDLVLEDDAAVKRNYEHFEKIGQDIFSETFVPNAYQGKGAFLWASASPLFSSDGKIVGAIETIRDVTQRKKMEDQLKYLATHDSLTKVPNRYSLEENLARVVAKAKRGKLGALLMIDIDNFKIVNDSLGHIAGDEVLILLANLLRESIRESDLLFRIGGDEFAIIIEEASLEEASYLAEHLRKIVENAELCLTHPNNCFNLSLSIGLAVIDGKMEPQKILSYADNGLYKAKEDGRNKVVVVDAKQDITVGLNETNKLIGIMKKALINNGFVLYYQPVVKNEDGLVSHYEVLLRLMDGEKMIMPNSFIPVAERYGLMAQIDYFVVNSAFEVLNKYKEINLMVNLSGASIGDQNLLESIEKQIDLYKIKAERIGFEITETNAVKDIIVAEKWIAKIRKMGCLFALDDFGMGFSSFSYLRRLPVDYIKIDGSFIYDMDRDTTHRAFVTAINNIAKALGKKTIAEYVERKEIQEALMAIGVDYSQGYYFVKPKPIENIIV